MNWSMCILIYNAINNIRIEFVIPLFSARRIILLL